MRVVELLLPLARRVQWRPLGDRENSLGLTVQLLVGRQLVVGADAQNVHQHLGHCEERRIRVLSLISVAFKASIIPMKLETIQNLSQGWQQMLPTL